MTPVYNFNNMTLQSRSKKRYNQKIGNSQMGVLSPMNDEIVLNVLRNIPGTAGHNLIGGQSKGRPVFGAN